MAPQQEELMKLAQFWASVSEEHNVDKFQTILSDDFVMWYNFDPVDHTREQFLDILRSAHKMFDNQVNEDTRITLTTDGFVIQATMTGVLNNKKISAPYCLIAQVKDGKVVRGDEYFDVSQLGSRPAPGTTEMVSVG